MELGGSLRKKLDSLIESAASPLVKSSKPVSMHAADPIKYVPKGWGYEKWIVNCPDYCGKILFIAQGKKCSWHFHVNKDEVFYVRKGAIEVTYGEDDDKKKGQTKLLVEGDKFHVTPGLRHQMYALKDTELFEFSTQHFDTDSYRIEKGD